MTELIIKFVKTKNTCNNCSSQLICNPWSDLKSLPHFQSLVP